jgi:hypothetical protein
MKRSSLIVAAALPFLAIADGATADERSTNKPAG